MKQIYIVRLTMSSPYFILDSREIDDRTQELKYKFKKETRLAISAVRTRYRKALYDKALDFYGLFMCGEEQRDFFAENATKANIELQAIDKMLHGSAIFIPLDMDAIKRGEMYHQIINAIYSRIFGSTADKLESIAKSKKWNGLTDRSKEALLKLVDGMKAINVLGDTEVTRKLNRIAGMIQDNQVEELQKELQHEIHALTQKQRVLRLS